MTKQELSLTALLVKPDNYLYILEKNSSAIVIDASSSDAVEEYLSQSKSQLKYILSTHHHTDHTHGNRALFKRYGSIIVGADSRIDGVQKIIADHDCIDFEGVKIECLLVPGHTNLHVAFYLPEFNYLFTGDTLFGAGCGRQFEGTPDQLYQSLLKIAALPDITQIYFGHEYTLDNLEFASWLEPANVAIERRLEEARILSSRATSTVPSTIALEKATNPFLRVTEKNIRTKLGMIDRSPVAVFSRVRELKNKF